MPSRVTLLFTYCQATFINDSTLGLHGESCASTLAAKDQRFIDTEKGFDLGYSMHVDPEDAALVRRKRLLSSFFCSLFNLSDNRETRLIPRKGITPALRRYGHLSNSKNQL